LKLIAAKPIFKVSDKKKSMPLKTLKGRGKFSFHLAIQNVLGHWPMVNYYSLLKLTGNMGQT